MSPSTKISLSPIAIGGTVVKNLPAFSISPKMILAKSERLLGLTPWQGPTPQPFGGTGTLLEF